MPLHQGAPTPRSRPGRTYEFDLGTPGNTLTVIDGPDGRLAEIIVRAGKQGSTFAGLCDCLSVVTSVALQHDVPVDRIVSSLLNQRFEPAGPTGDPDVPTATSLADYVGRRLAIDYLPGRLAELNIAAPPDAGRPSG
jgi:ribonucleoside-diphosphate reductase alpha chain